MFPYLFVLAMLLAIVPVYANEVAYKVDDVDPKMMYRTVADDYPKLDQESEVYMGDRMLNQRTGMYADCLTPNFGVETSKMGGWDLVIEPDIPICKRKRGDKHYFAPYPNGVQKSGTVYDYAVVLSEKKGKYKICLRGFGMNALCEKNLTEDDFELGLGFVTKSDSFQRVIEYNGKRGSLVRFVYSEFKDGRIRDAFTREFDADLNDGNVVAYKGAVFEVLDATNASIRYKVIRHFQN